jgi:hypothetical protein
MISWLMGLFHRHQWQMVSTYCDKQFHWFSAQNRHCGITDVVMRCTKCGNLKSKSLPGWHVLENIRGENDEVAKVLAAMEPRN